jgi:hypothetical protein
MKAPNDLREAYAGQKRGPQAGFASCLLISAEDAPHALSRKPSGHCRTASKVCPILRTSE